MKQLADHTATLRELAGLLHKHGLTEIELNAGELRIRLRRDPLAEGAPFPVHPVAHAPAEAVEPVYEGEPVEAPFMGIFYRAPKPNEPPFVEEEDVVEIGQPLCLIEANKVFSELTAPTAGRITRIVAENGALVHPGDTLLFIDTTYVGE